MDTCRTLSEVKKLIYNKGAQRVKIVSLLDKPSRRVVDIEADYMSHAYGNAWQEIREYMLQLEEALTFQLVIFCAIKGI